MLRVSALIKLRPWACFSEPIRTVRWTFDQFSVLLNVHKLSTTLYCFMTPCVRGNSQRKPGPLQAGSGTKMSCTEDKRLLQTCHWHVCWLVLAVILLFWILTASHPATFPTPRRGRASARSLSKGECICLQARVPSPRTPSVTTGVRVCVRTVWAVPPYVCHNGGHQWPGPTDRAAQTLWAH